MIRPLLTISDTDALSVVPDSDPIENTLGSDVGGAQDVDRYYEDFNWGAQPNVRNQMENSTHSAKGKVTKT